MTGFIKPSKPFLLGVAGGSGSGKTFFARSLRQNLGEHACEIIYQDNFYVDQSKKFDFDGGSVNFDHPDAIDFDLLASCLSSLRDGRHTEIPVYDFVTHSRLEKPLAMAPRRIFIIDGILIFHSEKVRALFDEMVFFDTPENIRFQRRLERDVKERGRKPEGVRNQFLKQVKPMHDTFVEPSRAFATSVVNDGAEFNTVLKEYCEKLGKLI